MRAIDDVLEILVKHGLNINFRLIKEKLLAEAQVREEELLTEEEMANDAAAQLNEYLNQLGI